MKYILFILIPIIPFLSNCAYSKKKHKKVIIQKELKIIDHKPTEKKMYKSNRSIDTPIKDTKPEKVVPDLIKDEDDTWFPFCSK